MNKLDDFFAKTTDLLHPRLRNWKAHLSEAGTSATLEIFQAETEVGQSQAELLLQFTKDGRLLPLETVSWDDDLNTGLIQLGIRAVSPEQEAERFALGLRAALRKADREFGGGYFNAVMVELVKDSDLTQHKEIAEVLKYAYANSPHQEGKSFDRYTTCRELITAAISGRARELTGPLKYSQEEAKHILVWALARYLDERFSVSSRREFGML